MTRRKKVFSTVVLLTGIGAGVSGFVLHGCSSPPTLTGTLRATDERSQKLTAMAAAEAAQIADVDARLTRQLNLADLQIGRGWEKDARTTLASARDTLKSDDAKKLNDHARISGWVSVSELSRRADDNVGANIACNGAVAAMRAIEDPATRCDYVMGIGNELQYLQGAAAAGNLLAEAGPWTKSIDDVARRRQAVVSFASALFNLDDFPGGQQMLRQEDNATWRSDTLTRLAMLTPAQDYSTARREAPAAAAMDATAGPASSEPSAASSPSPYFGKELGYKKVFQGQTRSQTSGE